MCIVSIVSIYCNVYCKCVLDVSIASVYCTCLLEVSIVSVSCVCLLYVSIVSVYCKCLLRGSIVSIVSVYCKCLLRLSIVSVYCKCLFCFRSKLLKNHCFYCVIAPTSCIFSENPCAKMHKTQKSAKTISCYSENFHRNRFWRLLVQKPAARTIFLKVLARSAAGWRPNLFTLCVCFCVVPSLNPNENP